MRIAFYTFQRLIQLGGFERFVLDAASAMADRGHQVDVITASAGEFRFLELGMNVFYGNSLLHRNARTTSFALKSRLGKAGLHEVSLAQQRRLLARADVVYVKNEILDLAMLGGLRNIAPPVIVGIHTPVSYPVAATAYARLHNALYLGPLYRVLLRNVIATHCSNASDTRILEQFHLAPVGGARFTIPLPIYMPPRLGPTVKSDVPTAVFAGRFTEQKGLDVLLRAATALHGQMGTRIRIEIAGAGLESLENEVRRAALNDPLITYLGHLSPDGLADCYSRATVAVVPSRWETFSYACAEALALGVPVVCSDIPGCRDRVQHGLTGLLVPPGDANELAVAIKEIVELADSAPEIYRRYSLAASEEAQRSLRPETVYDQMEEMFKEVGRGTRE